MTSQWSQPRYRKVTVQHGSTGFHLFMVVATGGAWLLVWPLFRRTRVIKVRSK